MSAGNISLNILSHNKFNIKKIQIQISIHPKVLSQVSLRNYLIKFKVGFDFLVSSPMIFKSTHSEPMCGHKLNYMSDFLAKLVYFLGRRFLIAHTCTIRRSEKTKIILIFVGRSDKYAVRHF